MFLFLDCITIHGMKGCRDLLFSIIEKTSCGVLGFLLTLKFNARKNIRIFI